MSSRRKSAAPVPLDTIVVTANDVLNGKGTNIAAHPGNQRFRSLVLSRKDSEYCLKYTLEEKKTVAKGIIQHIYNLDPPGRFLKRQGRSRSTRGMDGPWELLSPAEALRKTTQALRDCNRPDRTGYAAEVKAPEDVRNPGYANAHLTGTITTSAPAAAVTTGGATTTTVFSTASSSVATPSAAKSAQLPHVTPGTALSTDVADSFPESFYASLTSSRPSTPSVGQLDLSNLAPSPPRDSLENLYKNDSGATSDDLGDVLGFQSEEVPPFDTSDFLVHVNKDSIG